MSDTRRILALACLFGCVQWTAAQTPQPQQQPLTMEDAVSYAVAHYPQVRASLERLNAAKANVGLARTSYLPGLNMLWQSNRATYNNITGLLLPQSILPALSGPVLPNTSGTTAWGSAGGALAYWQPFDFGLRAANVNVARAGQQSANSQLEVTKLDVAAAAADAFLGVIVAQRALRAAEANVNRRETFAKAVHVLVDNQIRPGVDASRADAELAAAQVQLLRSQEAEEDARIALTQSLGITGRTVDVRPGSIAAELPNVPNAAPPLASNPAAQFTFSVLAQVREREHAIDRSYFPTFTLQSAIAGRGSGVNPNGTFSSGSNGLAPERYNWAIGLTATFPAFDFFSLRERKQIELANERAAQAEYDQTLQQLSAQVQRAQQAVETTQLIAQKTAIELNSARLADTQAEARYHAGLTTLVEVADAQQLLVQADIDDSVAKLAVWRALLAKTFAQGDLQPFLDTARKVEGNP
jgi:outer membrane protein TolC